MDYIAEVVCGERERFIKELVHEIMVTNKSEICRAGPQSEHSGRVSVLQFGSRIPSLGNLRHCSKALRLIDAAHPPSIGQSALLKAY